MDRRGLAIVSMLIFTIIFTILSGIILGILSNTTRDLESHIRGAKAYYNAEAATVFTIDFLRRNQTPPSNLSVDWSYDDSGNLVDVKSNNITRQASVGPSSTDKLNVTTDFSTPF